MSDEQQPPAESPPPPTDAPLTGLVHQRHGGSLKPGGNPRPTNPTPADVSSLARKRVYSLIPELNRIARNMPRRARGKKKDGTAKRPHRTADQIAAIAQLRLLAFEDRVSMSALSDALIGMSEDIRGFLPPETAEALLALIAPRFLSLR
jgi:hypothetical protein